MKGPDVVWYLCVAGFLFCTGALGVLIRRSPLIVLLSLEIMLNGANLALIAFSRHYAQGDGQIFALTVMAVAASEVVVGLGLIVAIARRKLDLDVDKLSTLRGDDRRRLDLPDLAARRGVSDHARGQPPLAPRRRLPGDALGRRLVRGRDRRLRRPARRLARISATTPRRSGTG